MHQNRFAYNECKTRFAYRVFVVLLVSAWVPSSNAIVGWNAGLGPSHCKKYKNLKNSQLASNAFPLNANDSATAPSARMPAEANVR